MERKGRIMEKEAKTKVKEENDDIDYPIRRRLVDQS